MNYSTLLLCVIYLTLFQFCSSYSDYAVIATSKTSSSISLTLSYTGSETYYKKPTSPIIKKLNFTIVAHTYRDLHFKITDATQKRFEIFTQKPFLQDRQASFTYPIALSGFVFTYTEAPFDFKIVQKETNSTLFSTYDRQIIFSNYYIQIGTEIESEWLFGLGQRLAQGFRVRDGQWTMFNRDRGGWIDVGIGYQTYGYFPFYMLKGKKNNFHLAYFRTSSALDVFKQQEGSKHYLTWKLIGGVINMRFFLTQMGQPQELLSRFHEYIGTSPLPPFWAMGYHQSRWGYNNVSALQNVVNKFQQNGLPLDVLWSDLDYMVSSQVFTIDQTRFPPTEMKKLIQQVRWIPIIDPGIKNSGPIYESGLAKNAYIMDANTYKPFLGKMRAGRTVYPDFFHENSTAFWVQQLQNLYNKVPYSGLWLDSNQFTSFCVGPCDPPTTPSYFDYNNDLPYSPGLDDLEGDTISLNSTHYSSYYGKLLQADVHVFNGFVQTYVTYNYLKKDKNDRPFILTRSSILGSNRWAAHWSGDNMASYEFLRTSIADIFNGQLFGFQMVGADICGFGGNATAELCARWYQLGSLYPFCRNHNHRGSVDQQPYALGEPTLSAARNNLKARYGLLKYMYSYMSWQGRNKALWKPLFFAFPNDQNLYNDEIIDTQLMLGDALMVVPILQPNITVRTAYFPDSNWYALTNGKLYSPGKSALIEPNLPSDIVPLFLREGYGLLYELTSSVTRVDQLTNRFGLFAAMKKNKQLSTDQYQFYDSSAVIMAIEDYSNNTKIAYCQEKSCHYMLRLQLQVHKTFKLLQIDVSTGQPLLETDKIIIAEVKLVTEVAKFSQVLEKELVIKGKGRYLIDIVDPHGESTFLTE